MREGRERLVRVGIADDNDPFRETLCELLAFESDIEVVGLWRNAKEAFAELAEVQPDILLLDIDMPYMSGLDAVRRLKLAHPELRVIMLTMHDDVGYVLESLKSGASGYLLKDGSARCIIWALRKVAAGGVALHPQVCLPDRWEAGLDVATCPDWQQLLSLSG